MSLPDEVLVEAVSNHANSVTFDERIGQNADQSSMDRMDISSNEIATMYDNVKTTEVTMDVADQFDRKIYYLPIIKIFPLF